MKKESSTAAVSRRGFLKGSAALGVSAALFGCSKNDSPEVYGYDDNPEAPDLDTSEYFYGGGAHNCGADNGCMSKAWVKNGRIIRITSEGEERISYDPNSYANPQQRACARCRSVKYRIYHPGRLKYPLKQTKERGNLSGFIRMDWDDALDEITRKHKAIINKYGPESIHSIYACGAYTAMQGGGFTGIWNARSGNCVPLNYVGGVTTYQGDYSYHQRYNWSQNYTGYAAGTAPTIHTLAGGSVKNFISFGDNSMTTRAHQQHAQVAAYKMARENGTNIIYIAPEFVDMGVNIADEFIPTKPYTTSALFAGMLHTMLINTFDENGNLLPDTHNGGHGGPLGRWLDVDFIDAAVYGFFDSPLYYIDKREYSSGTATNRGVSNPNFGEISFINTSSDWTVVEDTRWVHNNTGAVESTRPSSVNNYTTINRFWIHNVTSEYAYWDPCTEISAVAAGESYSAWLMGDDPRLTLAKYSAGLTYVADRFSTVQENRNAGLCNQPVAQGSNTAYLRKKQYRTPKDAAWASKITGIPEERIKELAGMWANPDQHPIWCNHGFGLEKQLDGIFTRFAMNAFLIITKSFGQPCHGWNVSSSNGFGNVFGSNSRIEAMPNYTANRTQGPGDSSISANAPSLSVTQWHNAIKMAFMDVMLDPTKGSKVYTAKYIPDYEPTIDFKPAAQSKDLSRWKSYIGRVYHDDGGAKALVKLQRDTYPSGTPERDSTTDMNYYVTENGKPVYSGYRFIINSGGNIMMNQHMNPNDTREVLESIPSCGQTGDPDNADDLCIVSFDPFLSPSPRWSDYVLPAATQWENDQRKNCGGNTVVTPVVSQPPGESKDSLAFAINFLKSYEKIRPDLEGVALQYTGHDNVAGNNTPIEGDTYIDKIRRAYERTTFATTSRYYGKTFEQALKIQWEMRNPGTANPTKASTAISGIRKTVEDYIKNLKNGIVLRTDPFYANISTTDSFTGYGGQYMTGTSATRPTNTPGRFQVYTEMIEWGYSKKFERWHKHLADQGLPTGQRPDDIEGDPIIPRIPYYFNYEDSFMEAYGGPDGLPPENNRFLVTTTHDRHRAHSSVAESPLVRELTHRVKGGGPYSGNDWGSYSLSEIGEDGTIPRTNSAIGEFGRSTDLRRASWTEVLMNDKDAEYFGIEDGDIIEMRNPVGAVRVAVRKTKRAAKGYIALHQGAWYDPDPVDGVDDGGCANTIMCMKPSRLDHGNGQQSAMVQIKKAF